MTKPSPSSPRSPRLGLALKLGLVLSLALLPLGLISVYQTSSVMAERRAASEAALLERTQRSVASSRELIRSAISAAQALTASTIMLQTEDDQCNRVFSELVKAAPHYVFAGFVDNDMQVVCSSTGERRDLSGIDILNTDFSSDSSNLVVLPQAFFANFATLSATAPVYSDGERLGVIWIAVPLDVASETLTGPGVTVDLAVFNADGDVLARRNDDNDRRELLPVDITPAELAERGRNAFRGVNRAGETRDFAVVPIIDDRVYALGSWPQINSRSFFSGPDEVFALFFPLVMWVIALVIGYAGINRLVIRHVKRLRHWMYLYSAGHGGLDNATLDNAPSEIEVLADAFRAMTWRISEHERRQQEDLNQISTLFKEVHHRVKNNLQLISSMMNMQIRTTQSEEAKRLLRRVQDRVLALSSIHRHLYMARKLAVIEADELLEEIIQKLVVVSFVEGQGGKIDFATALDKINIDPDQSVPLTLLATEATMNAVKYCGHDSSGHAWINVALKRTPNGEVTLSVVNSLSPDGTRAVDASDLASSGLGSKLIESFASQLNGTLEIEENEEHYELHVTFTPLEVEDPLHARYDEDRYFTDRK
ncbi:histidine kinase dimerization/phosphoacceptor domain -containing protein [Roseovarius sp. E0-M6]|uniref:histidine kinase dimerization/phosphoacceptor domain -containing protein n=1 Tax=Roseovarius sp. E0-M6 TaxID=3127118 RepID=UPI0030105941